ncbi:VOC family protein [Psychromicrobium xiongbiense]|uniref:VOC family protein n=1 Tax=Psychromicrobium xiongbiense TaxID=3051184 RepID=UPI0025546E2F|nr:VOC family protein [Psychromicrobium sp. YIM S02556]
MFNLDRSFSSFSSNDLDAARAFYAEQLGLTVTEEDGMLRLDLGGGRHHLIYPKDDHQPATYTALNFVTADIDQAVLELKQRGVVFEQYPMTDADGIMRNNGPLIAWFTDPAGNFLSVIQTS